MIAVVAMCRDEEDVAEHFIRHHAAYVDFLLVADNNSTDSTRSILDELACDFPLTVVDDPVVAYNQADKMTALARQAADMGAKWIVPADFDETWHGLDHLRECQCDVIETRPRPILPDGIRLAPERYPKVCFRWHPEARIHMGNHGVDRPGPRCYESLRIDHFQYRTLEQVRRKVRNGVEAYDATSLGTEYGTHWRNLAALSDEDLEAWWVDYLRSV